MGVAVGDTRIFRNNLFVSSFLPYNAHSVVRWRDLLTIRNIMTKLYTCNFICIKFVHLK